MKVRVKTLWKVPVYCVVSSWICFYITVYLGGLFFIVKTVGADEGTQISADPVRLMIFDGALFLAVLLIGGLWVLRSMTKKEIAVSAGITSAIYLLIILAQLYIPSFPLSLSINLVYIQNWTGTINSWLFRITGNLTFSAILSCFTPMLFTLFGKRPNT